MQEEHWDASLEWSTSNGGAGTDRGELPQRLTRDLAEPTPAIDGALGMTDDEATMVDLTPTGSPDAALVGRVLDDDGEAMAELYDRFADRIYTMCVHMLRDEDEAADVCGQVFLVALQRLDQLREPAKLRSWLYAIARNEVYRRTRDRARVRPMEEVDDMAALSMEPDAFEAAGPDATAEMPRADPVQLAAFVQAAAGGLEDRDRMVLELNVAQGLDGTELADALGVKVDNAYQMTHRMKERLERSASALLVVSAGRDQCAELDGVARSWDGTYDVLWRKRFARHVDRCERCQRMKAKLPKAVLAGAALSQAAQSAVLAAPISVREQVLAQAPSIVASETARPWSSDGFPRVASRRGRRWQFVAAAVVAVVVVLGLGATVDDGTRGVVGDTDVPPVPTLPGTSVPTTAAPPAGASDPTPAPEPRPTTTAAVRDPDATAPPGGPDDMPDDTTTTITEADPGPNDPSPGEPVDPGPSRDPKDPGSSYDPKNPPTFSIPTPTFFIPPVISFPTPSVPTLK